MLQDFLLIYEHFYPYIVSRKSEYNKFRPVPMKRTAVSLIVSPPRKPSTVCAEVTVNAILGSSAKPITIWIGIPYKSESGWTCEEHVAGCSQRKVLGKTAFHALTNALTVARIDLEAYIEAGYTIQTSENDAPLQNYDALKNLFSIVPFLK